MQTRFTRRIVLPVVFLAFSSFSTPFSLQPANSESQRSLSPDAMALIQSGSQITPDESADVVSDDGNIRTARAAFSVRINDEVNPFRIMGLFLMPGEQVSLEVHSDDPDAFFVMQSADGHSDVRALGRWDWTAPDEPGVYPLTILETRKGERMQLNVFVKVPFDHTSEYLNGYRIGRYAARPLYGDPAYERPPGFIEVTPENRDIAVAPNFKLGQFLSRQDSSYPKYLVLKERLLLKLETLLEAVNESGIETPTFYVMSAFRTPYYNRAIGNTTTYSQHLYGGAADIFIDTSGDSWMDDLTGTGIVTVDDAAFLAGFVEEMTADESGLAFVGGLGVYRPAPHRGPFIHVDVRGHAARW